MRKLLLSLVMLVGIATGWAQSTGIELGFTRVGSSDITDGMKVGFQTLSSTNYLNWFVGAGAAGEFGSSAVFVLEAASDTTYYLRQDNASDDAAYLQAPAGTGDNVSMGAKETAAAVEFHPYSEVQTADDAFLSDLLDNDLSTRVVFYVDGTATYMNSQGSGTAVKWATGTGSWSVWNIFQMPDDIQFVNVTFQCSFYDGSSDTTLEEAGLSSLIPSEAADGTVETESIVGSTISLPEFDNMTIRSATINGETVTEDYVISTDDVDEDGTLTVSVSYTSDPQITFHCTIDASLIGVEDGYYVWENSSTTQDIVVRFAVGEPIVAPSIDNYTAMTEFDEVASVSGERTVTYRPWRTVYADLLYQDASGNDIYIETGREIPVDIDSVLSAPDLGSLYTYNSELTAGAGNEVGLPLTVTKDNIYDGLYLVIYYDLHSPITPTEVTDDAQFPDDATWYILRLRDDKIMSSALSNVYFTGTSVFLHLADADADVTDSTLWCFRENADGTYNLYNRAYPGYVFSYGVSEGIGYPTFVDPAENEYTFDLVSVLDGYGLRYTGQGYLLNDYQAYGCIYIYPEDYALTDLGSQVTFEEYVASNYMYLDGRAILNAVDCLNGFSADDDNVGEIAWIVESGSDEYEQDMEELVGLVLEYGEADRVQYASDHAYAILSAAPAYISQGNVKYALYVQGDTTLGWKEFNEYDRSHYFMVGNMADLASSTGASDSTVCTFESVSGGTYVSAASWESSGTLVMSSSLSDDCYFHLEAVEEQPEGETTVYPASFYITRPNSDGTLGTVSMHSGTLDSSTSGTVVSSSTRGRRYTNKFRLYDTGLSRDVVGIESVVNDESAAGGVAGTGAVYDLTGRRVQKAVKGVYIQDGKKVYVK